ncbi:1-phosphatidylinositol phosphodiesterase [Ceratocystis lukuohia]|uniref:1-phosphatidylinositol phosphodiesterase n=1 Tax=Ceratocystis lukuohia TaxID=2019550 RepID=A0ABR4MA34_9PEZI
MLMSLSKAVCVQHKRLGRISNKGTGSFWSDRGLEKHWLEAHWSVNKSWDIVIDVRFSLCPAVGFLAVSYAVTYNEIEDPWSFDVYAAYRDNWIDPLADDTPLSSLAIPGTRDSMTYGLKSSLKQSQNANLYWQLAGGIRYIDVTCVYDKDDIQIYHGLLEPTFSLSIVLETVFDFLDVNKRETVILRIQRGGIFGNSEIFLRYFNEYFVPGSELGDRAAQRVYSKDGGITTVPTLGELRGKVFILQDFETSPPGKYGLPWSPDTVSSYKHRFAVSTLFLESKWNGIKSHLKEAPSPDSDKLRITHTTATYGASPIDVAARNERDVGMNKYLGRNLLNKRGT